MSILRLMLFLSPSAFLSTFIAGILIEKDRLVEHYNGIGNANASLSTPGSSFLLRSFPGCTRRRVLSLLLLLVEFKIISITSALTAEVLSKIKDLLLIFMAVLIYDDKLSFTNVFGCIFIFAGIFLFAKFKRKQHLTSPNQNNEMYEIVSNEDKLEDVIVEDSDAESTQEEMDKGMNPSPRQLNKSPKSKTEIELVDRFAPI